MRQCTSLVRGRLRNQADFYSLFGAICEIPIEGENLATFRARLTDFLETVEDEHRRANDAKAKSYYADARSASNDAGPRRRRIDIMKDVMLGEWQRDDYPAEASGTVQ